AQSPVIAGITTADQGSLKLSNSFGNQFSVDLRGGSYPKCFSEIFRVIVVPPELTFQATPILIEVVGIILRMSDLIFKSRRTAVPKQGPRVISHIDEIHRSPPSGPPVHPRRYAIRVFETLRLHMTTATRDGTIPGHDRIVKQFSPQFYPFPCQGVA